MGAARDINKCPWPSLSPPASPWSPDHGTPRRAGTYPPGVVIARSPVSCRGRACPAREGGFKTRPYSTLPPALDISSPPSLPLEEVERFPPPLAVSPLVTLPGGESAERTPRVKPGMTTNEAPLWLSPRTRSGVSLGRFMNRPYRIIPPPLRPLSPLLYKEGKCTHQGW